MEESSFVVVPQGWQREIEGDSVYYISPDLYKLRSTEEVSRHLASPGTCKCGLRCPFRIEEVFSFNADILSLPDHVSEEPASPLCKLTGMYQFSESPATNPYNGNKKVVPSEISHEFSSVPRSVPKQVPVPVIVGAKRRLPTDNIVRCKSEPTKRIKFSLGNFLQAHQQQQKQQQEQTIRREENQAMVSTHSQIKRLIEKVGRPKQASVGQVENNGITSLMWLADVGKLLGETLRQQRPNFVSHEPPAAKRTLLMKPPVTAALNQELPVSPVNQQSSSPININPSVRSVLASVSNSQQIKQRSKHSSTAEDVLWKQSDESIQNATMRVTESPVFVSSNIDSKLQTDVITIVDAESSINSTDQEEMPPVQSTSDKSKSSIHVSPAGSSKLSLLGDNKQDMQSTVSINVSEQIDFPSVAEIKQPSTVCQSLVQVSDNCLIIDKDSAKSDEQSSCIGVCSETTSNTNSCTQFASDTMQMPPSECSENSQVFSQISPVVKPQYSSPTKIALKEVEVKMNTRLSVTPPKVRSSPSKDITMRQFHIPIEPLSVCSSPQQQHSSRRELRWLARNKMKEEVGSKHQDRSASCNDSSPKEVEMRNSIEKEKPLLEITMDSGVAFNALHSNLYPNMNDEPAITTTTTNTTTLSAISQPTSEIVSHYSNPDPTMCTMMVVSTTTNVLTSCSNLTTTCSSTSNSTLCSFNSKPLSFSGSISSIPTSSSSSNSVQEPSDSIENITPSSTLQNINSISNFATDFSHSTSSTAIAATSSISETKTTVTSANFHFSESKPLSPCSFINVAASIKCAPPSNKNTTTDSSNDGEIKPLLSHHFINETTSISITITSTTPASATTSVSDSDLMVTSAASHTVENSISSSNGTVSLSLPSNNTPTTLSNATAAHCTSATSLSLTSNLQSDVEDVMHPNILGETFEKQENENDTNTPSGLQAPIMIDALPNSSDNQLEPLDNNYEPPTVGTCAVQDQTGSSVGPEMRKSNLIDANVHGETVSRNPQEKDHTTEFPNTREILDKSLVVDVLCGATEVQMAVDSCKDAVNHIDSLSCTAHTVDPLAISSVGKPETCDNDEPSSAALTITAQTHTECSAAISSPTNNSCNLPSSDSVEEETDQHSSIEPATVEPNSEIVSPKIKNATLIESVDNLLKQIEHQKMSSSYKKQSSARNNSSFNASVHSPVKRVTRSRSKSRSSTQSRMLSTQSARNSRSISVDIMSAESGIPAEGDNSNPSCVEEPSNLIVSLPLSLINACTTALPCNASNVEIGDIVWAKAPKLVGWPGKIISSNRKRGLGKPPYGKVWIEWIGHSTVSLVDVNAIKPLEEGIKLKCVGKARSFKSRQLQLSIDMALKLLHERKK